MHTLQPYFIHQTLESLLVLPPASHEKAKVYPWKQKTNPTDWDPEKVADQKWNNGGESPKDGAAEQATPEKGFIYPIQIEMRIRVKYPLLITWLLIYFHPPCHSH